MAAPDVNEGPVMLKPMPADTVKVHTLGKHHPPDPEMLAAAFDDAWSMGVHQDT